MIHYLWHQFVSRVLSKHLKKGRKIVQDYTMLWNYTIWIASKHVLQCVMFAYFTSDLQLCSDGRRVKEPFLDMFVDALTKVGALFPIFFVYHTIVIFSLFVDWVEFSFIPAWWLFGFLPSSPSREVSNCAKHTSSRQMAYSTRKNRWSQRVQYARKNLNIYVFFSLTSVCTHVALMMAMKHERGCLQGDPDPSELAWHLQIP